jgi:hypothetical protein
MLSLFHSSNLAVANSAMGFIQDTKSSFSQNYNGDVNLKKRLAEKITKYAKANILKIRHSSPEQIKANIPKLQKDVINIKKSIATNLKDWTMLSYIVWVLEARLKQGEESEVPNKKALINAFRKINEAISAELINDIKKDFEKATTLPTTTTTIKSIITSTITSIIDCNVINYSIGKTEKVLGLFFYPDEKTLCKCAPKGKFLVSKQDDDVEIRSVVPIQQDACKEISLNAGRKGFFNNPEDLQNCLPKDENEYKGILNSQQTVICKYNKKTKTPACKTETTPDIPFKYGRL